MYRQIFGRYYCEKRAASYAQKAVAAVRQKYSVKDKITDLTHVTRALF